MAGITSGDVAGDLRRLFREGSVAALDDAQLLERFVALGDEVAFGALVARHGPMVQAVCNARLRDRDAVEDAFQATFLVLVERAGSIRGRGALGGWLHKVAHRVAARSIAEAARRRSVPGGTGGRRSMVVEADRVDDGTRAALHEEVARLPEKLRLPVVLCHLEGQTHDRAARELGCGEATLRRRLAEARKRLRARLSRRGVTLSGAALASAMAGEAGAAVPAARFAGTVRAAVAVAAGRAATGAASATAAALARRVLRSMLVTKFLMIASAVVAAGGAALVASQPGGREAGPAAGPPPEIASQAPMAPPRHDRAAMPGEAEPGPTLAITGRVLDPGGKPVAGAKVRLVAGGRRRGDVRSPQATSGADGRFSFSAPTAEVVAFPGRPWITPRVVAAADGFGAAWAEVGKAGGDSGDLLLVADLPIRGRVLDLEGRPVAGAKVAVARVATPKGDDLSAYLATVRDGTEDGNGRLLGRGWSGGGFPGRPSSVSTDADGRFRLDGVGRERLAELAVEAPAIQNVSIVVATRDMPAVGGPGEKTLGSGSGTVHGATFDLLVRPGRTVVGVVRDRDTKKPLAGMRVGGSGTNATATTGADGRFAVSGFAKGEAYELIASPGDGQPYFVTYLRVPDVAGLAPIEAEVLCGRGIVMRLRLTDKETGEPVRGAEVSYWPLYPNPRARDIPGYSGMDGSGAYSSGHQEPDGSYRLGVLPGPGALLARAEGGLYRPACVDPAAFFGEARAEGNMLNRRFGDRAHLSVVVGDDEMAPMPQEQFSAIVLINPPEGSGPLEAEHAMERDRKSPVRVIGPDDAPVEAVRAEGLEPAGAPGAYTIAELNPMRPKRLVFRQDAERLVGFLMARGNEPDGLVVKLQPWGTIAGRLLDAQGKPRPGVQLITKDLEVHFDDPLHGLLPDDVTTDREGRFRIDGLVPGQQYGAIANGFGPENLYGTVFDAIRLRPGEVRELGDIRSGQAKPAVVD